MVSLPVPEQALDADEQLGSEPAQPLLGPELEEGIGLEPSLLRLPPLTCRDGGLDPVERSADDVEIGGARVLPRLGKDAVRERQRSLRELLHPRGIGYLLASGCPCERGSELVHR